MASCSILGVSHGDFLFFTGLVLEGACLSIAWRNISFQLDHNESGLSCSSMLSHGMLLRSSLNFFESKLRWFIRKLWLSSKFPPGSKYSFRRANNFKPKGLSSDRWFSDIFRIYWMGKYCLLHKRTLATQKDNTLWTEKSDETCQVRVRQFSPVRGDMIGKTAAVTTRLHLSVIETVMHEGLRTRTNFRGVPSPFQNREENKKATRNDISVPLNGARGVVLGAACC